MSSMVPGRVHTGRALSGLTAAVREGDVRRGERAVLLRTGRSPGLLGAPAGQEHARLAG